MRRGNRHLVGVVMGGRSGGSRDAIMRACLPKISEGSTKRTVAAISERNPADANTDVAEAEAAPQPPRRSRQVAGAGRFAGPASRRAGDAVSCDDSSGSTQIRAQARDRAFTSGVIQTQQIAAIPGSSEPMKPVRVKTVQIKAGPVKLASAGSPQPAPPVTSAIRPEPMCRKRRMLS